MIEILDIICQVMIPVTGVIASFLVGSKAMKNRMYAGILGFSAQPFWFGTSIINEQWGIVLLSFFYTYTWVRVYRNNRSES